MTQIALTEAQQKLAEIVEAVGRGEEFVITVEGKPAAKVSAAAHEPKAVRKFGSARGMVTYVADDFDAPLDDFAEYM